MRSTQRYGGEGSGESALLFAFARHLKNPGHNLLTADESYYISSPNRSPGTGDGHSLTRGRKGAREGVLGNEEHWVFDVLLYSVCYAMLPRQWPFPYAAEPERRRIDR
jgi:hypothetical protein